MAPAPLLPQRIRRSLARRRAGLGPTGRIFGIGLSRTGTTSLTVALDTLGYRSVHFPTDDRTQAEIMDHLSGRERTLRLSILKKVDTATDTPICAAFEALDQAYPGSRFIYTVRDRDEWLNSCRRFWDLIVDPFVKDHPNEPGAHYMAALFERLYGGLHFDRARFARAFADYDERVTSYFHGRPSDLLTLDICGGEGWGPLCSYLGAPEPKGGFPAFCIPPDATWLLGRT